MRLVFILFLLSFASAQSFTKVAVDSAGGIYTAQGTTISKVNQWSVTVPFTVLTLSAGNNLIAGGLGSITALDPASGKILSTSTFTPPVPSAQSMAIAASGNIILSGQGPITPTAGAINIENDFNTAFIAKADASGKLLWAAQGIGGAVAVDSSENVYVAGQTESASFPTTAGAFQSTASFNICGSTGGLIPFLFPCPQQYIAKVSADGSKVLFATFLTGKLGALPRDIALASDGSVYSVGSVQATDYPVTSGALIGAFPGKLSDSLCSCIIPITAYPITGFLSRVSGDGTALLYSTFIGGSQTDYPSAIALGKDGGLTVGGMAGSPDFPGLGAQLDNCRPGTSLALTKVRNFVMQISADGATIAHAQLIGGTNPGAGIACVTDAADGSYADTVSPGELITLNGIGVGPAVSEVPGLGSPAMQIGGVSVLFDGIPAGLTAAGGTIVSAEVPFAVTGKQQTTMTVMQNGVAFDSRQLNVTAVTPSLFVLPPNGKACNAAPQVNFGSFLGGSAEPAPMIFNADGTINACDNPAAVGSVATFFMNGLGVGTPQILINGVMTPFSANGVGSQTSVTAVGFLVPAAKSGVTFIAMRDGDVVVRDYQNGYGIPLYVK